MFSKSKTGGGGGRGPRGYPGTPGPPGPPGGAANVENYVAIANQALFPLGSAPATPALVLMYVNGVLYVYGTDYTVAGSTATWLNVPFVMNAGDTVTFVY
jgi:hypothetical protein